MLRVIAIIGKAGTGKDALLHYLMEHYPSSFHYIINSTTRPIRENEIDGVNYHFLTQQEMEEKINNQEMVEWDVFNDWYYGTEKSELAQDKVNIGIFNNLSVMELAQNKDVELKIFELRAPDKIRLLRQLNREDKPNCAEICRRFISDEEDYGIFTTYFVPYHKDDFTILSNVCKEDLDTISSIILGQTWSI